MADYQADIDALKDVAAICEQHVIKDDRNLYPRWPNAWAACEVVWCNYLEMQTMAGPNDEADRKRVILEAGRLR